MTMFRIVAAILAAATLSSFSPPAEDSEAETPVVVRAQPEPQAPVTAQDAAARLAFIALAQQGIHRYCEGRLSRNDAYESASPEEKQRLMNWCLSSITVSY